MKTYKASFSDVFPSLQINLFLILRDTGHQIPVHKRAYIRPYTHTDNTQKRSGPLLVLTACSCCGLKPSVQLFTVEDTLRWERRRDTDNSSSVESVLVLQPTGYSHATRRALLLTVAFVGPWDPSLRVELGPVSYDTVCCV